MSNIIRYKCHHWEEYLDQNDEGDLVLYEDYQQLEQQLATLQAENERLKAKNEAISQTLKLTLSELSKHCANRREFIKAMNDMDSLAEEYIGGVEPKYGTATEHPKCPVCYRQFICGTGNEPNYCSQCGTKIKWDENEGEEELNCCETCNNYGDTCDGAEEIAMDCDVWCPKPKEGEEGK